jgi:arylsulfatase A
MMIGGLVTTALALVQPKPNFLVLFADDLGAGDLQVYGHPTTITPNLDALAAGGTRFTQWYSGFHVCTPSRASMMTGRLPIRLGMAGAGVYGGVLNADAVGGLPSNETTIAEALRDVGYATKAIGKWHLGQQAHYLPTAHGFDEYYGIPYSDDMGSSAWRFYNSKDRPPHY